MLYLFDRRSLYRYYTHRYCETRDFLGFFSSPNRHTHHDLLLFRLFNFLSVYKICERHSSRVRTPTRFVHTHYERRSPKLIYISVSNTIFCNRTTTFYVGRCRPGRIVCKKEKEKKIITSKVRFSQIVGANSPLYSLVFSRLVAYLNGDGENVRQFIVRNCSYVLPNTIVRTRIPEIWQYTFASGFQYVTWLEHILRGQVLNTITTRYPLSM